MVAAKISKRVQLKARGSREKKPAARFDDQTFPSVRCSFYKACRAVVATHATATPTILARQGPPTHTRVDHRRKIQRRRTMPHPPLPPPSILHRLARIIPPALTTSTALSQPRTAPKAKASKAPARKKAAPKKKATAKKVRACRCHRRPSSRPPPPGAVENILHVYFY